jgi:NAD(P)-dependent dehydrogenase (short-subunit alcohol dehydrogenase family)
MTEERKIMPTVLDLFDLSGKRAIVTGAARGLGRQSALALAEAGADVAICDILEAEGEQTSAAVRAMGRRSFYARVDVTASGQIGPFVQRVIDELGPIDILVNNAGIGSSGRSLEDEDENFWRHIIDANLSSMFYFAKPVAKHMIERQQGGVIINMASVSSLIINKLTPRHNVCYCVSKAGVLHLTRGMASDWAPHKIRVNAIAPGYMTTQQTVWLRSTPDVAERALSNVPMMRWGREDELKGAVVFLASAASSYMTGSALVIDGGMTIW